MTMIGQGRLLLSLISLVSFLFSAANGQSHIPSTIPSVNPSQHPSSDSEVPSSSPSLLPTWAPSVVTAAPSAGTGQPSPTPSIAPSTEQPTLIPYEPRRNSFLSILAKTVGWLILIAISVLLFGAIMSNRYRILFALRGVSVLACVMQSLSQRTTTRFGCHCREWAVPNGYWRNSGELPADNKMLLLTTSFSTKI